MIHICQFICLLSVFQILTNIYLRVNEGVDDGWVEWLIEGLGFE